MSSYYLRESTDKELNKLGYDKIKSDILSDSVIDLYHNISSNRFMKMQYYKIEKTPIAILETENYNVKMPSSEFIYESNVAIQEPDFLPVEVITLSISNFKDDKELIKKVKECISNAFPANKITTKQLNTKETIFNIVPISEEFHRQFEINQFTHILIDTNNPFISLTKNKDKEYSITCYCKLLGFKPEGSTKYQKDSSISYVKIPKKSLVDIQLSTITEEILKLKLKELKEFYETTQYAAPIFARAIEILR